MSYMYKCASIFRSEYARLENNTQIHIDDYLASYASYAGQKIYCIPYGHELIPVQCETRRCHFRHRSSADLDVDHPMSEWHAEWQSHFPSTELPFRYKADQTHGRRADVVFPEYKRVLEFQHSPIERGEVMDRNSDYSLHGYHVSWIIDARGLDKASYIIEKQMGDIILLEFIGEPWHYKSFVTCDYVYYDLKGMIYKVYPTLIKSNQVTVDPPVPKALFVEALKRNEDHMLWNIDAPDQSKLIVIQQGAGSGKTYTIIQGIDNMKELMHHTTIIYLSKQHSAVNVIHAEFEEQYRHGRLPNITVHNTSYSNKKYIIEYTNHITKKDHIAIFATVDSFTYSLGESSKNASDKFKSIVESIVNGTLKTMANGRMKFAGIDPIMNKDMAIVVDEVQDLSEIYGEALLCISRSRYATICVVGDRLQSLANEKNALTYLYQIQSPLVQILVMEKSNHVRRFSHPDLIHFVNELIPFQKWDLPYMSPAIPYTDEKNEDPSIVLFEGKSDYAYKDDKKDAVSDEIDIIMKHYEDEVCHHHRVPEDFLIVTPFTKNNVLCEALSLAIELFWKEMMTQSDYVEEIKSKHTYWSSVADTEYQRYAVFHKSEEGNTIDLRESEHSTRIVSIHSSKGDGRNVVFVIGVTQKALERFVKDDVEFGPETLIYSSLLHVAITRQKQRLYFRVEPNHDDIHRRIKEYGTKYTIPVPQQKKEIKLPSMFYNIQKMHEYLEMPSHYNELYERLINHCTLPLLLEDPSENTQLIDMEHHYIRAAAMYMNIMIHCCNHLYITQLAHCTKNQFKAIIKSAMCMDNIKIVGDWKEYYASLPSQSKEDTMPIYIPLLRYTDSYCHSSINDRYYTIIYHTMTHLCNKLQRIGESIVEYCCPYESIIMYYMIETYERGIYQNISIRDIYHITHIYASSNMIAADHQTCICSKLFDQHDMVTAHDHIDHYERLHTLMKMMESIHMIHPCINWLYQHYLSYGDVGSDEFETLFIPHIIGYDADNVYNTIVQPQLNSLNYPKLIVEAVIRTFVIYKSREERFTNHRILTFVLSLNRNDMYTLDLTEFVKENDDYLTNLLFQSMLSYYKFYHPHYNTCLIHHIRTEKEKGTKTVFGILNELSVPPPVGDKKGHLQIGPKYMHAVWKKILDEATEIRRSSADVKKDLTGYILKDHIPLMDEELAVSLSRYLKTNKEDEIDLDI